jgi:hypothetical protein
MPTHDEILALIAAAQERAATEVSTWIPEKPGDRIAGVVRELGTITTIHGDYYTTTIAPFGRCTGLVANEREDFNLSEYPESGPTLLRVAWMGTVLDAQYRRMRPGIRDIVAMHYQKDVTPRIPKGNDYALIEAVILDGTTGDAKVPVDLAVHVPTTAEVMGADLTTGELPLRGTSPLDPASAPAGETPFE